MHALVEIALGNALVAALLALPAAAASRLGRWPALAHGLWLLVFVKLLTPVAVSVPVTWPALTAEPAAQAETSDGAAEIAAGEWVAIGPLWAWEEDPFAEAEAAPAVPSQETESPS